MMYPDSQLQERCEASSGKRCSYNIISDAALLPPSGLVSLRSSRMGVVPLYLPELEANVIQRFLKISQSRRMPLLALSHLRHLSPHFRSIYCGVHAHSA